MIIALCDDDDGGGYTSGRRIYPSGRPSSLPPSASYFGVNIVAVDFIRSIRRPSSLCNFILPSPSSLFNPCLVTLDLKNYYMESIIMDYFNKGFLKFHTTIEIQMSLFTFILFFNLTTQ